MVGGSYLTSEHVSELVLQGSLGHLDRQHLAGLELLAQRAHEADVAHVDAPPVQRDRQPTQGVQFGAQAEQVPRGIDFFDKGRNQLIDQQQGGGPHLGVVFFFVVLPPASQCLQKRRTTTP